MRYTLIKQFIRANGYFVDALSTDELVETLYADMVEYSFLTEYLTSGDVEEINVNAWNDVAIHFVDIQRVKRNSDLTELTPYALRELVKAVYVEAPDKFQRQTQAENPYLL